MNAPATLDDWADRYGELQPQWPLQTMNWIGIPVLVMSLLGLLWSLPVPAALSGSIPMLNWAGLFLMAAFVYYCILSIRIALVGLVFLLAAAVPSAWLELQGLQPWPFALAVFVPAFAGQLIMTRHATGHACVLRNVQYLMLGPIWLLRSAFRRAGLRY